MQLESQGCTLQATALVHEAYLRMIEATNLNWRDRAHFFAVSAQMMLHILVDAARTRSSAKRGGKLPRINLNEIPDFSSGRDIELLALDDALETLARFDPRKGQVIELRSRSLRDSCSPRRSRCSPQYRH
jgi:RNA polymerase sigma factor (TIGR02999 family)